MAEERTSGIECGKFKIELRGVGKRVVVLPVHITLEEVHVVIQRLFCWDGGHLWEFQDGSGRKFRNEFPAGWGFAESGEVPIPPSEVCLSDILPDRGGKLHYTYDFGDGWEHVITRMADPQIPGRYCAKTEGPDGIEDVGGAWGMQKCKADWHVPDAEEITMRLEGTRLNPRKGGTGIIKKADEALETALKGLSPLEWKWLGELGDEGFTRIFKKSKRFDLLAQVLPGVRCNTGLSMLMGGYLYQAESGFRRLWRKKREEWERLRREPAEPGLPPANFTGGDGHGACKTPQPGRNDPCPCGSGKKFKTCCGKGA